MYIICDDINVYGFHRNIPFWIASKTFQYGFKQIGLDAKIILNTDSRLRKLVENGMVMVFPHHFNLLQGIQCRIILYNSEALVISDDIVENMKDPRVIMVLDYEYNNILYSEKLKLGVDHLFVPPVYSPTFTIEPKTAQKDIDVLFYGHYLKDRRMAIKKQFEQHPNIHSVWTGTFQSNEQKYEYIRRAKIIIIVHAYEEDFPIDYFRMTELISNKIFFIHEMPQKSERILYEKYKKYIIFAKHENIVTTCIEYLNKSQEERDRLALRAYQFFSEEEKIESYMEPVKEKMSIVMRKIRKEDYEQYVTMIDTDISRYFYNNVVENILSDNHIVVVLDVKGEIVGCGTLLIETKMTHGGSKMGHIENIFVKYSYRKRGYGKKIVKYLTDCAKKDGCYRVDLCCEERLKKFYQHNGFSEQQTNMSILFSENFKQDEAILVYSICYYYGKNKRSNIENHLKAFLQIKNKKKFVVTLMMDDVGGEIHLSKMIEKYTKEYEIIPSFNWGGTILGLWQSYQYCKTNYPNCYLAHFEEDFGPYNQLWWPNAKDKLTEDVIFVGESRTGKIKTGNDDNRITCPGYYNSVRMANPEVWTDGGFYFSTLSRLKKMEEKIGIFHKGDPSKKWNHILDGIDYGEIGFPTLLYHNGFKFDVLNRKDYFKNEW